MNPDPVAFGSMLSELLPFVSVGLGLGLLTLFVVTR